MREPVDGAGGRLVQDRLGLGAVKGAGNRVSGNDSRGNENVKDGGGLNDGSKLENEDSQMEDAVEEDGGSEDDDNGSMDMEMSPGPEVENMD